MNKHLQMVRQFHTVFNFPQADRPTELTFQEMASRCAWMTEQLSEFFLAKAQGDKVAELQAVIDAAYICVGTAAMMGCNLPNSPEGIPKCKEGYFEQAVAIIASDCLMLLHDPEEIMQRLCVLYFTCQAHCTDVLGCSFDQAFTEVHRSNMSKLDGDGNPLYNEHGKIIKSALFTPTSLEAFIND